MDNNQKIAFLHPPKKGGVYSFTKSGSLLWDEQTDAWTYHTNAPPTEVESIYRAVPVIFRGVAKIANSVASMPFDILTDGGDVFDSSDEYENKLEWLPNPNKCFSLISQSVDLTGVSYHRILRNPGNFTKELRYQAPQSIEPHYDLETGNLDYFIRTWQNGHENIPPDEILYHWLSDPYRENEPPGAWPVKAALNAAGILKNLDSYIIVYFERGAVRPIIVSVPRGTAQAERERMGNWFTRLMGGIRQGFTWKVFESDAVQFEQIGDGLESLENSELTTERKSDVATALGVPTNILFSEAVNFATAQQDKLNFYDDTIVPRCEFIESVFNEQLLSPLGYNLRFKPETLDIYQEDENARSESAARMTQAIATDPKAFKFSTLVLGMELTDEAAALLDELIADKEAAREEMQDNFDNADDDEQDLEDSEDLPATLPQNNQEMRTALVQWHRRTLKAAKKGDLLTEPFVSDDLPSALYNSIAVQLQAAKTVDDVNLIFDRVFADLKNAGEPVTLVQALIDATQALMVANG